MRSDAPRPRRTGWTLGLIALWVTVAAPGPGPRERLGDAAGAAARQAAAIFDAVKAGDATKVRSLVEADPSLVSATDDTDRTPLHWAARGDSLDVLRLLVDRGADVNAVDRGGNAAIHGLSSRGNTEGLRLLLDSGADVNLASSEGNTALHLAAQAGQLAAVRLLLSRKADIERANSYGRTPLVLAAREMGGVEVIRALLEAGAKVDAPDKYGDTALSLSAWRGSRDVVDLLLSYKASIPTGRGASFVLDSAISKGLSRLFLLMAESGADLSLDVGFGRTGMHSAAEGGAVPIIETLAKRGLDVKKPDAFGWTPLHFAADYGRADAIAWLLEHGAAIDARTAAGQTAFNVADENDDADTRKLLAAKGADTAAPRFPELRGPYLGQTPPGKTPVMFAPGIVSAAYGMHSNVVFSPDGTEAFWSLMIPPRGEGYSTDRTLMSRLVNGKWTYPRPAVFGGVPLQDVPFFHPDGRKLYDMSDRPMPPGQPSSGGHIWVWDRGGPDGWTNPRPVDAAVNNLPLHWQFAVDRASTLYFNSRWNGAAGIFRSRLIDGRYEEPHRVGAPINGPGPAASFPFVAPDGSYMLFTRGRDEIVVSFRNASGGWSEPVSLGPGFRGMLPVVSPDGKYLFLSRDQRAWWADAGVIEELRKR